MPLLSHVPRLRFLYFTVHPAGLCPTRSARRCAFGNDIPFRGIHGSTDKSLADKILNIRVFNAPLRRSGRKNDMVSAAFLPYPVGVAQFYAAASRRAANASSWMKKKSAGSPSMT